MNKHQAIRLIDAAEGFDDMLKAAAILSISLMPRKQFDQFAELADEGLRLLQVGDYDGLVTMVKERDAPPQIVQAMEAYVESVKRRAAGME